MTYNGHNFFMVKMEASLDRFILVVLFNTDLGYMYKSDGCNHEAYLVPEQEWRTHAAPHISSGDNVAACDWFDSTMKRYEMKLGARIENCTVVDQVYIDICNF